MKKKFIYLLSIITLFFSACSSIEAPTPEPEPDPEPDPDITPGEYIRIPLTEKQKQIVTIGNDFAFDFFKNHSAMYSGENTTVSPFSLFTVLSMMTNGADGDLQDEILRELYGNNNADLNISDLNEYASHLLTVLPDVDRSSKFRLSNSVWGEKKVGFLPSFLDIMKTNYQAERVEKCPAGEKGMKEINAWVSDKTNGFLPEFLKEPFDGDVSLINAIYFYGKWTNDFEVNSKDKTFYSCDGSEKPVPFINQEEGATYYEDEDLKYVSVPYGNKNYAMDIILPKEGKSLSEIYEGMNGNRFQSIYRNGKIEFVYITLPKFETYFTKDLLFVLNRMGLRIGGKLFNKMVIGGVYLSKIIQGVKIRVDENGTEAAGATGADFPTLPGPEIEEKYMICDRPFMYLIRETSTGVILFMGKVEKL